MIPSQILNNMKHLICLLAVLAIISCTETPLNPDNTDSTPSDIVSNPSDNDSEESSDAIYAEKDSWKQTTKSSDDKAFAKDIPWQDGEKVMVIRVDSEKKVDQWGRVDMEDITYMCTVSKAAGLKCTLEPETPLESGIYHAVYPVYDYVSYNASKSSLCIHLSFLYELGLGLDYKHQDIVISDPVTYKEGHKLSFVMRHVCALVDIDIYPPKTGKCSLLKIISEDIAFAGKANYDINDEYDIDNISDGWFNYTTLRGDETNMTEGELFHTSTGLLPIQYDGMPMRVYMAYDDGTYYLSEPFPMPSLDFGVLNSLTVNNFNKITEPMQGLWGDCYMDKKPHLDKVLYWDCESSVSVSSK